MKKGETIKGFFSNENKVYSFEVYPKLDKETLNQAFDDESLNNFRLVSVTKKDGYQPIFQTTNRVEMYTVLNCFLGLWSQK